ncbi:MAG TPA: hypothetical protein VEH06_01590 [Candidatus Bathyarchaeia archaeon]|nr:hypothetical protein [Candidatus Bathyarchaeia archaeon]
MTEIVICELHAKYGYTYHIPLIRNIFEQTDTNKTNISISNAELGRIALKSHRCCAYDLQKARDRHRDTTNTVGQRPLRIPPNGVNAQQRSTFFNRQGLLADYGFQVVNFKPRPPISPNNQFTDLVDFGFFVDDYTMKEYKLSSNGCNNPSRLTGAATTVFILLFDDGFFFHLAFVEDSPNDEEFY